ncbi:hypothetical protein [Propioniferax innocua]|uniref:hypothetical protein n=1 Tax=Propioniferax innocua TaxID=1753 RepID=UPI00114EE7A0|nr:hypothetical protein [Propioniferax innocua]
MDTKGLVDHGHDVIQGRFTQDRIVMRRHVMHGERPSDPSPPPEADVIDVIDAHALTAIARLRLPRPIEEPGADIGEQ